MHSGIVSCLLAVLALPFCAFAESTDVPSVTNLPKNIPYSDETTGVVFPAKIGPFTKIAVQKNSNPFFGTTIRYAGSFGTSADIYIYSLSALPSEISMKRALEHYEQVKNSILGLSAKASELEQIALEGEYSLREAQREVGRRAVFHFQMDGEDFTSELVIFPYGNRIVKFRVTSPSESTSARKAAGEFLRTICGSFFKETPIRFVLLSRSKISS